MEITVLIAVQDKGVTAPVGKTAVEHGPAGIDFVADERFPVFVGKNFPVLITHLLVVTEILGEFDRRCAAGARTIRRIIHLAHHTEVADQLGNLETGFLGIAVAVAQGHLVPLVGMAEEDRFHVLRIALLGIVPPVIIGG